MECERALNLIDAYMDGELDAVHTAEMEVHLAGCAQCKGVLGKRRMLQQALRTSLPYFAAPEELKRELGQKSGGQRRWGGWIAAAACLALAVGGITLGVAQRGAGGQEEMLVALVGDHLRSLQVDHLVDVQSTDHHTVKPWFAGKLAFTPPVQELDGKEFKLEGGRVDVVNGREAAALVYRHGGHVINLFVWPGKEGGGRGTFAAMRTAEGFETVHWRTDEGMECWAVSDMDAGELMRFSQVFYQAGEAGKNEKPG